MRDVVEGVRRGAGARIAALCSPTGLRGAAVEGAWMAAHLALYPVGLLGGHGPTDIDRFTLQDLPPVQRGLVIGDVEAAGTPILLVHGMVDNRSIFTVLRRALRRRGFGRVVCANYSVLTTDVRAAARRLAGLVEQLCADTGYERIHVVAHSMGGIIARYYVQRLGGDARVHTLVTLGSPHAGTALARLVPHALFRQLSPGSDLVAELAGPAPGCRTRFVAYYSDLDQLMAPSHAARIDHPDLVARNVHVRGVGHMSLPIHGAVVREICETLAIVDAEGHAVTAGTTSIASRSPAARTGRRRGARRAARQSFSTGA